LLDCAPHFALHNAKFGSRVRAADVLQLTIIRNNAKNLDLDRIFTHKLFWIISRHFLIKIES
jgi:hypothetical protein